MKLIYYISIICLSCSTKQSLIIENDLKLDELISNNWHYQNEKNDSLIIKFSIDSIFIINKYRKENYGFNLKGEKADKHSIVKVPYKLEKKTINFKNFNFLAIGQNITYTVKLKQIFRTHSTPSQGNLYMLDLKFIDVFQISGLREGLYFRQSKK